jgi:TetR/AcrR family transcriptional repressor of nem operon
MQTKAERTRQFIIEQAAPLINKKGMAATSITDIMAVTKLAKGGIYGNFENKEEICSEALGYLLTRLSDSINQAVAGHESSKEKIFALLDFYQYRLTMNNIGGCPMQNFGTEADDTNPVIKQHVAKAIRNSEQRIRKILQAGVRSGEFKPTLVPEKLAIKIFAMLQGAILVCRVLEDRSQMGIIAGQVREEIESYAA